MLHNIGTRAAIEVAQLYISFPEAAQEPPKILKGFKAVYLNAGASTRVSLPLTERDVSIWDSNLHLRGHLAISLPWWEPTAVTSV